MGMLWPNYVGPTVGGYCRGGIVGTPPMPTKGLTEEPTAAEFQIGLRRMQRHAYSIASTPSGNITTT